MLINVTGLIKIFSAQSSKYVTNEQSQNESEIKHFLLLMLYFIYFIDTPDTQCLIQVPATEQEMKFKKCDKPEIQLPPSRRKS